MWPIVDCRILFIRLLFSYLTGLHFFGLRLCKKQNILDESFMNLNISHANESWFTVSKCNEGCKGQFQIKNPVKNWELLHLKACESCYNSWFSIFNT